jgi:hypothetical protein
VGAADERLGECIASGDLDGDGDIEVVIGSRIGAFDSALDQHQIQVLQGEDFSTQVGTAMALSANTTGILCWVPGDINDGGADDLVVKHWNGGAIFLGEMATGSAPTMDWPKADDLYLWSLNSVVALDFDGDGIRDLAVSDPGYRDSSNLPFDSGRVVVYWGQEGTIPWVTGIDANGDPLPDGGFSIIGTAVDQRMGENLANLGDLDGDGDEELGVGAPGPFYGGAPGFFEIYRGRSRAEVGSDLQIDRQEAETRFVPGPGDFTLGFVHGRMEPAGAGEPSELPTMWLSGPLIPAGSETGRMFGINNDIVPGTP